MQCPGGSPVGRLRDHLDFGDQRMIAIISRSAAWSSPRASRRVSSAWCAAGANQLVEATLSRQSAAGFGDGSSPPSSRFAQALFAVGTVSGRASSLIRAIGLSGLIDTLQDDAIHAGPVPGPKDGLRGSYRPHFRDELEQEAHAKQPATIRYEPGVVRRVWRGRVSV